MSRIYSEVVKLIKNGEVLISSHGYDELVNDNIYVKEIIETIDEAEVINEYPDYSKGPCVLILQKDRNGRPLHVVWGIPKNKKTPAVLVTAYRPNRERWNEDFSRRKK
jgi:hypothetical protein